MTRYCPACSFRLDTTQEDADRRDAARWRAIEPLLHVHTYRDNLDHKGEGAREMTQLYIDHRFDGVYSRDAIIGRLVAEKEQP